MGKEADPYRGSLIITDRGAPRKEQLRHFFAELVRLGEEHAAKERSKSTPRPRSVPDEHAHVAEQRCECGGSYNVVDDDHIRVHDEFFDTLRCECVECGEKKSFSYNVTALVKT